MVARLVMALRASTAMTMTEREAKCYSTVWTLVHGDARSLKAKRGTQTGWPFAPFDRLDVFVVLERSNQVTTHVTPANSRIRQLKDRQTDVADGMAKNTHEIFQHDSLSFIIECRKRPEW